jgi:hypothetical protein
MTVNNVIIFLLDITHSVHRKCWLCCVVRVIEEREV